MATSFQFAVRTLVMVSIISLLLTGCSKGYKVGSSEVEYHSWNEAEGHQVLKLDADPNTFEILDSVNVYAKDRTHVYAFGTPIVGADPQTFRVTSDKPPRGEDVNWIYHGYERWKGRDPEFKEIGSFVFKQYAVDSKAVYYRSVGWQIIPGADPATFEIIPPAKRDSTTESYGRDKNDVYCGTIPLRVNDPAVFKLLDLPSVASGSCLKTSLIRNRQEAIEQFGERYADLQFVENHHHDIASGVGTDGTHFYDYALKVEQKPKFVGESVAKRLKLVEGKDYWLK